MPTESQLQDATLRLQIRERIQSGRLPLMFPQEIYAGRGEGNLCPACDQPITSSEIEYEVDAGSHGALRLHLGCHAIWQMECHTLSKTNTASK